MATVDPAVARVRRPEAVGPPEDAASSSGGAALWELVLETQAGERYFRSWLELLARGLDGLRRALLILGPADRGPYPSAAFWPEDQQPTKELLDAAEAALRKRSDVVLASGPEGAREGGLVAHPLLHQGRLHGAVVLDLAPPGRRDAALEQLRWGTGWLFASFETDRAAAETRVANRFESVLQLLAAALEHQRFQGAATAFATELATLLHCDRVAVGVAKRGKVQLRALSHSASFSKKTNLVRAIEAAMAEAIDCAGPVTYPVPEGQPRDLVDHEELGRRYGSTAICSIPLVQGEEICGVLTLERSGDEPFDGEALQLCEAAAALAGPILDLRRREDRWTVVKAAEALGVHLRHLLGPDHVALKLATAAVTAMALFLGFANGEYRVTADVVLEPEVLQAAVAPFDGYITESHVRPGDVVDAGAVLAALDDRDLLLERTKWSSQHAQHAKQYRQALAERDAAQVEILSAAMQEAQAELERIDELLSRTRLLAPFAGVVVAGDLSQRLGTPISRGDVLIEVAPLEAYRVVLEVDERDIAHVAVGQSGQLVLTSLPQAPVEFEVVKLTPVASAEEGRNFFRVEARLHDEVPGLRPGVEGVAKVEVGERRLVWIWTHDFVDWLRLAAWSWLP